MNISILGCGRWGSFLAWYFSRIGLEVVLWGREASLKMQMLKDTRSNDYLTLPHNVQLTTSLCSALDFSNEVIIAIEGQNTRTLMEEIDKVHHFSNTFILCMKGLENETNKRLSEVAEEYVCDRSKLAVWVGPGQPKSLINGIPTCMIVDSWDIILKNRLSDLFSSSLIKLYPGDDMIGNEVSSAAKNVIGIAAGMLDGLGQTPLKGLLMVIGTQEIAGLIQVLGGNYQTAYGLACLGDFQASLFSEHSNSVNFGVSFARNRVFDKYTPGVYTAKAISKLIDTKKISLPLLSAVDDIITNKRNVSELINIILNYNYSKGSF
jgi:glycerol-3-phosphate dehydrogenase (NAD(P)+)